MLVIIVLCAAIALPYLGLFVADLKRFRYGLPRLVLSIVSVVPTVFALNVMRDIPMIDGVYIALSFLLALSLSCGVVNAYKSFVTPKRFS